MNCLFVLLIVVGGAASESCKNWTETGGNDCPLSTEKKDDEDTECDGTNNDQKCSAIECCSGICHDNFNGTCPSGKQPRGEDDEHNCYKNGCDDSQCCDYTCAGYNFTCHANTVARGVEDDYKCNGPDGCHLEECCLDTCANETLQGQTCLDATMVLMNDSTIVPRNMQGYCTDDDGNSRPCLETCCMPSCQLATNVSCTGATTKRVSAHDYCFDGTCDEVECCAPDLTSTPLTRGALANKHDFLLEMLKFHRIQFEREIYKRCNESEDFNASQCTGATSATFPERGHHMEPGKTGTFRVERDDDTVCTRGGLDLTATCACNVSDALIGEAYFRVTNEAEVTVDPSVCEMLLVEVVNDGGLILNLGDNTHFFVVDVAMGETGRMVATGSRWGRLTVLGGMSNGTVQFDSHGQATIAEMVNGGEVSCNNSKNFILVDVINEASGKVQMNDVVVSARNITNRGTFFGDNLIGLVDDINNEGSILLRNTMGSAYVVRNTGTITIENISGHCEFGMNHGNITIKQSVSTGTLHFADNSGHIEIVDSHGIVTLVNNTGILDIDAASTGYLTVTGVYTAGTINVASNSGVTVIYPNEGTPPSSSPTAADVAPSLVVKADAVATFANPLNESAQTTVKDSFCDALVINTQTRMGRENLVGTCSIADATASRRRLLSSGYSLSGTVEVPAVSASELVAFEASNTTDAQAAIVAAFVESSAVTAANGGTELNASDVTVTVNVTLAAVGADCEETVNMKCADTLELDASKTCAAAACEEADFEAGKCCKTKAASGECSAAEGKVMTNCFTTAPTALEGCFTAKLANGTLSATCAACAAEKTLDAFDCIKDADAGKDNNAAASLVPALLAALALPLLAMH